MGDLDTRWSEESILQALTETVSKIKKRNLSGALDTLIYLNFERLVQPAKDPRTLQTVDLGSSLGADRVRETGDQIRLCEIALRNSEVEDALAAATAALATWQQR